MTNLTIQLDPVALREATSQAIMGILTPEVRAELISKAISALLAPSTNSWDKNKSPLEIAFNDAVNKVAREVCVKIVDEDPAIRDRVKALAAQTMQKVFNCDIDEMAKRMAQSFVDSMRRTND